MKYRLSIFISLLFVAMSNVAKAQVEDVSVTVSPLMEYQWWNGNINLDNNLFYGVRLGFGFGPNFELRATAEKSLDIKSKLKSANWNIDDSFIDKLPDHKVNITRIGGEAKFNIFSKFAFSPYLTAGAGVQYFDYDPIEEGIDAGEYKEQQIFASVGAGIKMNISPRVVFTLEAKDLLFNMDPKNIYFNPHTHDKDKHLNNFAALASLDFYLGGTNTRNYSSLDARVRDSYTSGFAHGLKFVLEPGVVLLDYNKDTDLPNQWFVGGSAGIDFSSLVGIRGFYYQATEEPKKLSTKFNSDLRMYGVNVIARLNQPRGIVPYLQLGAGYLDNKNEEKPEGATFVKHNLFAQLGAGIEIPLSKYFAIYGSANALLMSQKGTSPKDIIKPAQVKNNMMYTAGLRINIGSSVNRASSLYASALEADRQRSVEEINELRAEYDEKIADLNRQLEEALKEGDNQKVSSIIEERDTVIKEKSSVERESSKDNQESAAKKESTNKKGQFMTAREFEELLNRVIKNISEKQQAEISSNVSDAEFVTIMSALQGDTNRGSSNQYLVNELRNLSSKIEKNNELLMSNQMMHQMMNRSEKAPEREIINIPSAAAPAQPVIIQSGESTSSSNNGSAATRSDLSSNKKQASEKYRKSDNYNTPVATTNAPFLKYNMLAPILGFNLGEQATANIGLRAYLQVSNTSFDFVPEIFIALGKNVGYGISGNVIYNFSTIKESAFQPYVGAGLGLVNQGQGVKGAANIILGTNINLKSGSFFADYTIRNFFKNNQIAVGYRFVF